MNYSLFKLRFPKALAILSIFAGNAVFSQTAPAPKKIALIIGIGKYPPEKGWNTIHGDNDVDLLTHALTNAGFAERDIHTLKNEQASKAGIVAAFKQLLERTGAGDMVLLHYSGHGQQVTDLDGDEADGLDEALVPYDAPADAKHTSEAYEGDKHFTDDELSGWWESLRAKAGPTGQLIVIIDACHSGTLSRGNSIVRGGMPPFLFAKGGRRSGGAGSPTGSQKEEDGSGYLPAAKGKEGNDRRAKFILFSATRAEETDLEYREKELGSLSYAIADALENKIRSAGSSFRDLFEYVRNTMAIIVPLQNPQLEGDKDAKIFGGGLVIQEPFYRVAGETRDGYLEVMGGQILGMTEGTVVGLFPIGTRTSEGRPVVTGKVIKAGYLSSVVSLERKIGIDSAVKLQAYVLSSVLSNALTKVFIGKMPPDLSARVREELLQKKIPLVATISGASLVLEMNGKGQLEIQTAADRRSVVNPFDPSKEVEVFNCDGEVNQEISALAYLTLTIGGYARNHVILNATFGDRNFGLDIRLLPAKVDSATNEATLLPSKDELPAFNTLHSQAILRIENKGAETGYVYLVELGPSGTICPLMGFDKEIRLQPGEQDKMNVSRFLPPYGRYLIKGYITETPIRDELLWLISGSGMAGKGSGSNNRLVRLLGELMQYPGVAKGAPAASGGASITNFSYDIVEMK